MQWDTSLVTRQTGPDCYVMVFIGTRCPWSSEWKIISLGLRRWLPIASGFSRRYLATDAMASTNHRQRDTSLWCLCGKWEWENRSINPIKFCYAAIGSSGNINDTVAGGHDGLTYAKLHFMRERRSRARKSIFWS